MAKARLDFGFLCFHLKYEPNLNILKPYTKRYQKYLDVFGSFEGSDVATETAFRGQHEHLPPGIHHEHLHSDHRGHGARDQPTGSLEFWGVHWIFIEFGGYVVSSCDSQEKMFQHDSTRY